MVIFLLLFEELYLGMVGCSRGLRGKQVCVPSGQGTLLLQQQQVLPETDCPVRKSQDRKQPFVVGVQLQLCLQDGDVSGSSNFQGLEEG